MGNLIQVALKKLHGFLRGRSKPFPKRLSFLLVSEFRRDKQESCFQNVQRSGDRNSVKILYLYLKDNVVIVVQLQIFDFCKRTI